MNVIDPGMRGGASLSGSRLAGAAALGAGAGLVVAMDAPIAHAFDWLWFGQQAPYALSSLALGAALTAVWVARHRALLWRDQFALATVAIVYSLQMMGIDAGPINPLNVVTVVVCALWLLHRFVDDTASSSPSGFFHLTVLYMACVLASALNQGWLDVVRGLLTVLPKLVLVLILTDILYDRRHLDLAVRALIASSAFAALFGMMQSILFFGYQFEATLVGPDESRYVIIGGLPVLRASGLQPTAHDFALVLAVAALIALYLAGTARGWRRAWFAGASSAALVAVILSVVRGQWIGASVGLVLLPIVARPRLTLVLWVPLGIGLFAVGIASGLLPSILLAVESINEAGSAVRLELLSAGIRALMDHPISGVGIGNFASYFITFERYPVHNAVIQAASELGVIGGLVFLTSLAWVGARLVYGIRAVSDPGTCNQLKALLLGYVCLIVAIQLAPAADNAFVWFYLVLGDSAARVALREAGEGTPTAPAQQGGEQRVGSLRPGI